MLFPLRVVTCITFFILGPLYASDLFEGDVFGSNCIKRRLITGCPNETLLSAYNQTEPAKSDTNINKARTRAYLFTPCNKQEAEYLDECGGRLPENTNFRPYEKTVVLVGGYISPICGVPVFLEIKDQLVCGRPEFLNVIIIGWNWGNGPDYYGAAKNTEVVGKQVAFLIKNIIRQTGAESKNFHIVGHSLGSHIAGCIGEHLQKLGEDKPGRITALDPAGPAFMNNISRCSFSKDDAEYTDAIHTNKGYCLPFALGIPWNVAHADFYPNGGTIQLSCLVSILTTFLKGQFYYGLIQLAGPFCPHFSSLQYFKESIMPCTCQFVGVECTEEEYKAGKCNYCGPDGTRCAVMGYDWDRCQPKYGNLSYFLTTRLACPTCDNSRIDLGGFSTTPPMCGDTINCFEPGRCAVHDC